MLVLTMGLTHGCWSVFLWCNFSLHEATARNYVWRRFLEQKSRGSFGFPHYLAEASKGWDEPNPREMEKMKPQTSIRGVMYSLPEDLDTKAKVSTLARRLEELEMRNHYECK